MSISLKSKAVHNRIVLKSLSALLVGILGVVSASGVEVGGSGNVTIHAGSYTNRDIDKVGSSTVTVTGINNNFSNTAIHGGRLVFATGSRVVGSGSSIRVGMLGQPVNSAPILEIETGSRVEINFSTIANHQNTGGRANIHGEWINNSSLSVGNNGNGTLNIFSGGSVKSTYGDLGGGSDGSGYAIVSGKWELGDNSYLNVGREGYGRLTIQAGGEVSNTFGRVAASSSGEGWGLVLGTWSNSSQLSVGEGGTGTLEIASGGIVNVGLAGGGVVELAVAPTATGTLNIGRGFDEGGTLNASSVNGGSGTAVLNFNHRNSDYHFTQDGSAGGNAVEITGSTSVNFKGTGATSIYGDSSYAGDTTLSSGNVIVNNGTGSAFGTGNVFIEKGATLSGGGGFSGRLHVTGTISPGNSPGTLNTGSQIWAEGGAFVWEINDADGVAGTNWDLLNIAGSLDIENTSANPFDIQFVTLDGSDALGEASNFDPTQDYVFTLVSTTGEINGFEESKFNLDFSSFKNEFDGTWSVIADGNNLNAQYLAAVPEPSTIALIGAASLGLFFMRRKQRKES